MMSAMTQAKTQAKTKRGDLAKQIRRLMQATGLSDEACRLHIRNGTKPRNHRLADLWDRAIGRRRSP